MSEQPLLTFKPTPIRLAIGIIYYILLIDIICIPLFALITNSFYNSFVSKTLGVICGQLIGVAIFWRVINSNNSIQVHENGIEGPSMYGNIWKRINIPFDQVILNDYKNNNFYSKILFGHVISSTNGERIYILWLDRDKFEELLELIKVKVKK
jgi:hypothetical protein